MRFFKSFTLTITLGLLLFFLVVVFHNMRTTLAIDADLPGSAIEPQLTRSPLNTKAVAAEIAGIILAANPEGPQIVNGQTQIATLSPEDMVSSVLTDKLEAAVIQMLETPIDTVRFLIVDEPTNSDLGYYLQRRTTVIREAAELIQKHDINFMDQESVADLLLLVSIYEETIKRLYTIPVPKNLVFVHTEQIRLLETQKKIFEGLANYEEDPLTATLAISLLQKMQEDELALQETLTDLIITYSNAS